MTHKTIKVVIMGMMIELSNPPRAAREMRKHLSWYARGIPGAVQLRRELQKLENEEVFLDLVDRFFFRPDRMEETEEQSDENRE